MILLFLIVLVGGAFAIAVLASDAHFGKANPKDGTTKSPANGCLDRSSSLSAPRVRLPARRRAGAAQQ